MMFYYKELYVFKTCRNRLFKHTHLNANKVNSNKIINIKVYSDWNKLCTLTTYIYTILFTLIPFFE